LFAIERFFEKDGRQKTEDRSYRSSGVAEWMEGALTNDNRFNV
jgi:hypothetical protein